MEKLQKRNFNAISGEIIYEDFTNEEIEERENNKKIIAEKQNEIEKNQKLKKSAFAKLAALGLTEDEIAAL